MLEFLDVTTLFSATGAASLAIYIIYTDKKDKTELKALLKQSQADSLSVTVETTSVLKDMDQTIQKQNDNHDRIEAVLQLILGKL